LLSYSVVKEPAADRVGSMLKTTSVVLTIGPARGLTITHRNRLLFQDFTAGFASGLLAVGLLLTGKSGGLFRLGATSGRARRVSQRGHAITGLCEEHSPPDQILRIRAG